jgi:hypothetical protein
MKTAPENRQEIAQLLQQLEEQVNTLRIEFEQFFAGVIKFQPEKLKAQVERDFRTVLRAPLKNPELTFRARSLKYRFNTLDSYWRRVLREKEEGRYHKDRFKTEFRTKQNQKQVREQTKEGRLEKQLRHVYDVYKRCLAEEGQEKAVVSFDTFNSLLSQKASALQKANPGKKVQFNLVLKAGVPTVEANMKEN